MRVVTDNGSPFKSDAFLKFFRERPFLEHIRTRHYAPQTNGVVERFNGSLKYEHLYRLEISHAWELAEEVEAFLQLYNEVRPHEAIGFRRPLEIYRADPHLFLGESVQKKCPKRLTRDTGKILDTPRLACHIVYVRYIQYGGSACLFWKSSI